MTLNFSKQDKALSLPDFLQIVVGIHFLTQLELNYTKYNNAKSKIILNMHDQLHISRKSLKDKLILQ